MNQYQSKVRSVEFWSRLVAFCYIVWVSVSLLYLTNLTAKQPTQFAPLQIIASDSTESQSKATEQWQAEAMPTNHRLLVANDGYQYRHVASDQDENKSFQQALLEQNEQAYWEFRSYWAIAHYLVWHAIVLAVAGLLALLRVRVFTGITLTVAAVLGMPPFTSFFRGPFEASFAASVYWLSGPVLLLGLIYLALAIRRWRLVPITSEVANDWKMFGIGFGCLAVGSVLIALVFTQGVRRVNSAAGVPAAYGIYLIFRHGRRLLKHHRDQNKKLDESGDAHV